MTERSYRFLKTTALTMALAWVAWSVYDFTQDKAPGDFAYHAASNYFAEGDYPHALAEYQSALRAAPDHLAAKRGLAETLIMLGREREAIALYQELLAIAPENAGFYANLGIAYDRLGEHQKALQNYTSALELAPDIADGPSWLTRFLRKQYEKPPSIAERAAYLRQQLALPKEQQVLALPSLDQEQQPYKK